MSEKTKRIVVLAFYALNLAVIIPLIAFVITSPSWEITLAIYLVVLTGFVSYSLRIRRP